MSLRCIIIDDEEAGIETLRLLIAKHTDGVEIVAETTCAETGIKLIKNYLPEIVFLDIGMPEMNGFELLENLSWKGFHLVFTTAHQEYGLKAIKNQAIDYLLKPIDPGDLISAIHRIKKQIVQREENKNSFNSLALNNIPQVQLNKLAINAKTGIEYVDPIEIVSLKSKSNFTLITLSSGREILSTKTLKEFEDQLCASSSNFMRVHRSFVINLRKIQRYLKDKDSLVMANNHKVPISKSRKGIFYKWLNL